MVSWPAGWTFPIPDLKEDIQLDNILLAHAAAARACLPASLSTPQTERDPIDEEGWKDERERW